MKDNKEEALTTNKNDLKNEKTLLNGFKTLGMKTRTKNDFYNKNSFNQNSNFFSSSVKLGSLISNKTKGKNNTNSTKKKIKIKKDNQKELESSNENKTKITLPLHWVIDNKNELNKNNKRYEEKEFDKNLSKIDRLNNIIEPINKTINKANNKNNSDFTQKTNNITEKNIDKANLETTKQNKKEFIKNDNSINNSPQKVNTLKSNANLKNSENIDKDNLKISGKSPEKKAGLEENKKYSSPKKQIIKDTDKDNLKISEKSPEKKAGLEGNKKYSSPKKEIINQIPIEKNSSNKNKTSSPKKEIINQIPIEKNSPNKNKTSSPEKKTKKDKEKSIIEKEKNDSLTAKSTSSISIIDVEKIVTNKSGLSNLGNTCFMNTCLQFLIHCKPLIVRFLMLKEKILNEPKKLLSKCFYELLQNQICETKSSNPRQLKDAFSDNHPEYGSYRQHDTQEFCRLFLEDLSKELNKVEKTPPYIELKDKGKTKCEICQEYNTLFKRREDSIVVDTFYIQIVNIFKCTCNYESYSFENYLDLPLLVIENGKDQDLKLLLQNYFGKDKLEWTSTCEGCKLKGKTHIKEVKLAILPEVLILSLQRCGGRSMLSKTSSNVKFYKLLNLSEFIDKDCVKNVETKYELIGISHHHGTVNFGHYYAHTKVKESWIEFNDSSVSNNISIDDISRSAYVLIYERLDVLQR